MATRRRVLAGLAASALAPRLGWAEAGNPGYLSAARDGSGAYRLFGLSETGQAVFSVPLPGRGHAAAAHPRRAEAVAFARRPGTFALVLDCAEGRVAAELTAPPGRHFYGHGAFSGDGSRLYTSESDYDAARGIIGVWEAGRGYRRIGEFPSGGIGPHEILRLPGAETLVVANGGIETHPASGRTKLNLPTMRPNLAYLSPEGRELDRIELATVLHMNSIRHLSARADGLVAAALQWQGDLGRAPPLLMLHRRGAAPRLAEAPGPAQVAMQGYAGSIAFSGDGTRVAITSPRGGQAHVFDAETGRFLSAWAAPDICGVAATATGLLATTGTGDVIALDANGARTVHPVAWDNHLVALA
ncbi:MAG: DUF1513 domain-containing protein [Pseudomonadota bacterium]